MTENKFVKLSDLVGEEISVNGVGEFNFKMWDNESKRMLSSKRWEKGYRKVYTVYTDKGTLDMSASQIGSMMEGISKNGSADIVGRTFKVASNGKSGMDIRYFINPVFEKTSRPAEQQAVDNFGDSDVDLSDIPF